MLGTVAINPRRVDDYVDLVGESQIAELRRLAAPLRGLRITGISLFAFGSWLTELLSVSVPLLRDLGVDIDWRVAHPDQASEPAILALYAGLGGVTGAWSDEMRRSWQRYTEAMSTSVGNDEDVVIVHDPQLLGLVSAAKTGRAGVGPRWIWHSHLDLSSAEAPAWESIEPYADRFDACIVEDRSFSPAGWQPRRIQAIPPAIDPLGPGIAPLDPATAAMLVRQHGIDSENPLILQVSPLDQGSDTVGLIEAYDALLSRFPRLQLAIVPASIREDDATRALYDLVAQLARERPGCRLLPSTTDLGRAETNALQQVASVVVQKSLRRGFALWLSEAMWQERPVVAGRTVGTTAQVVDTVTGYLVGDTAQCVDRIAALLADPALGERFGRNGRAHVANHFLITRYLTDLMQLLGRVVAPGEPAL